MSPSQEEMYAQQMYQQSNAGFGATPQPPRGDRADLIDKLKPEIVIEVVRQRLMGKELKNGTWVFNPSMKDMALTEEGAFALSNLMLGTQSLNTSLSQLEDHEIKRRVYRIIETGQILCCSNHKRYGIKNVSQLWFVHEILFTNSLVVFKQAQGASIQELLKGTTFENRQIVSEIRPKGRFLSALFGGNR